MKRLFTIDIKDYKESNEIINRPSARAIILKDDKLMMVYSKKEKYYKFPGGGIKDNETREDALTREVKEEVGLVVVKDSIKQFGSVLRIQQGDTNKTFVQENFYYFCDVEDNIVNQELDDYEKDAEFILECVDIDKAISINSKYKTSNFFNEVMIKRELRVLELLKNYLIINKTIIVNDKEYKIIKLLGHGKGGYSYLARCNGMDVVLKQIHHEPCDYYQFGNKIEAEYNDYKRLLNCGIRIPKMIDIDMDKEIIIKEYIDGDTIFNMIKEDINIDIYIKQVKDMAELSYNNGLNIDYFPTNFVVQNGLLYYIDYECNNYMDEWSFDNWGVKYWSKTKEFIDYIKKDNH